MITKTAAIAIKLLLRMDISVRKIQSFTGIHWDTIRKLHEEEISETIKARQEEIRLSGYKPRYLAVDEFAILKGHIYATCVMDIELGDVLWVGKGKSIKDFSKFFESVDKDYLSEVKAVAIDMNASYNYLINKYLPNSKIIYDRYHMQSQFGREVIGSVRLSEAKKHKKEATKLNDSASKIEDKSQKKEIKNRAKEEQLKYREIKKSRWTLLTSNHKLSEDSKDALANILSEHKNLSTCYAMKEEMINLFNLTAEKGWFDWFKAALSSDIEQLEDFAKRKVNRLVGLISHAIHNISTGKLEGFNNKIKVLKRIAYGYRNINYFFNLIKFISIGEKIPIKRTALART